MTTLYFSQYGNDANDGLTQENAKKDFTQYSNVGNVTLKLKCGEEFNFDSHIQSFYVGTNVSITSYGEGKRPIISGYLWIDEEWVNESNKIYYMTLENYVQYESVGNQKINIGSIRITNNSTLKMKVSFNRVYIKDLLVNEGDYFIDYENDRIYVYTELDPALQKYELARPGSCFTIQRLKPNVNIENVEINGFSKHGICGNFCSVVVSGCYVHNIGGQQIYPDDIDTKGWERYGNGIEVWGDGSENVLIEKNYIESCFDAGYTAQASASCTLGAKNVEFRKNVVRDCYYLVELFNHSADNPFINISVHDNVLLNCNSIGYRKSYNAYSQLCIWSQAYKVDNINLFENIFAYTNKYSCYVYSTNNQIYCNVYDNVFATDGNDVNQKGNDLIQSDNKIYDTNELYISVYVSVLIAMKLFSIDMLEYVK